MKTIIYKQSFWKFRRSFLQTASCCLLGKVFSGFMETFWGDLVLSNHISLEGIHRFPSSVGEKKRQNLFSKETYP